MRGRTMLLTCSSSRSTRVQSSVGCSSQSTRGFSTGWGLIPARTVCSAGPVVESLVRWSARMASVVDMQAKCSIYTRQPSRAEITCTHLIIMDAERSFLILRDAHQYTTASLSMWSKMSCPIICCGTVRNGSSTPTASNGGDLQPYVWSLVSRACRSKFFGHMTLE